MTAGFLSETVDEADDAAVRTVLGHEPDAAPGRRVLVRRQRRLQRLHPLKHQVVDVDHGWIVCAIQRLSVKCGIFRNKKNLRGIAWEMFAGKSHFCHIHTTITSSAFKTQNVTKEMHDHKFTRIQGRQKGTFSCALPLWCFRYLVENSKFHVSKAEGLGNVVTVPTTFTGNNSGISRHTRY